MYVTISQKIFTIARIEISLQCAIFPLSEYNQDFSLIIIIIIIIIISCDFLTAVLVESHPLESK